MLEFDSLLGNVRSTNYGVVVDGNELNGLSILRGEPGLDDAEHIEICSLWVGNACATLSLVLRTTRVIRVPPLTLAP